MTRKEKKPLIICKSIIYSQNHSNKINIFALKSTEIVSMENSTYSYKQLELLRKHNCLEIVKFGEGFGEISSSD